MSSLQDSPPADGSKPPAHACQRLRNSHQFSQQGQLATCGELGKGGPALVGTPEGADGEVVAGAGAQGLQGVLAEGGLQAEGGPPALPIRQPVLQQDGVHLGARRRPLHEGHRVGDIPHQDLRWAIDDCGGGGGNGHLLFWGSWMGKGGSFGGTKLRGCLNLTFRVAGISTWGQGREVAWARDMTLTPRYFGGLVLVGSQSLVPISWLFPEPSPLPVNTRAGPSSSPIHTHDSYNAARALLLSWLLAIIPPWLFRVVFPRI